jgi:hypothetical protein
VGIHSRIRKWQTLITGDGVSQNSCIQGSSHQNL